MNSAFNVAQFAKAILITLLLSTLAGNAVAQDSARSRLSLTRSDVVRIINIDDWIVGIFAPDETISVSQYEWDWQCVHSTTGSYRVEVSSANGGAQLALQSDNGDQMAYQIFTYSRRGGNYLLTGHTTPNFTLTNRSASLTLNCSDEPSNTNLWFTPFVRPGPFNAAPPGIYRDVITMVVSPE